MINDMGQVYYCETDENKQPEGEWKEISLDLQAISVLH